MAFTYTGDPSASLRDLVRFLIGDTIEDDPQLQDGEIDYLLSQEADPRLAAADGADAIAAYYARMVNTSVEGFRASHSEKMKHYVALADRLRDKVGKPVQLYAGGIDADDKEARAEDDTITPPFFTRDFTTQVPLPLSPPWRP